MPEGPPPLRLPTRGAAFARTPPAIFSPILGLLGLALAVRLALPQLALDPAPGDLLAGIAVALWVFAALAYGLKLARRPGVVAEDLRALPGRAGLAALTVGGMATGALVAPFAPGLAKALIVLALIGHAATALVLLRLLARLPAEARRVNPTLHLSFVGFIVAGPGAVAVGWTGLASAVLWLCLPVALAIWGLSAVQFAREVPPPPLRPLLAIHAAPAALMATVAGSLGLVWLSEALLLLALLLALALALGLRWLTVAGISPIWAAFTFPLAALALALIRGGGLWQPIGLGVLVVALGVVPAVLWWVLKRWPGGRLAAMTNAAEA